MKIDKDNKWVLLAGGPNSGKTTLLEYFLIVQASTILLLLRKET